MWNIDEWVIIPKIYVWRLFKKKHVLAVYTHTKHTILDISSITPVPISETFPFNREDANHKNRAAEKRYNEKITKYEQISKACGIKFQPFIFETTGKIHPSSLNWFKEVMRTNVHDYMGGNQLEEYWIKRINCAYLHHFKKYHWNL